MKTLRSHLLLYAAGALLFAQFGGGPARAERSVGPLWPLPIQVNLTSSFCEYRGGHLHAGIDIKTYGRDGVPCRAVDGGHVSRLRASPRGYGKALYLTLDSGETIVYAHLAEFSARLEAVLRAAQIEAGNYTVDRYFDVDSLRVARGDIVGYTGSTGTGAPHLHFEIRDDRQNPMNPLSHGFQVDDGSRPVADGVVWYPLTPQSTINGACRSFEQVLTGDGKRTFAPGDTVEISGRFGLSARIVDRVNPQSGRLAPYAIEVTLNGKPVSSILMESFTYDHTREVELAYDMARVRAQDKHYLMLYKQPGETLWHREYEDGGVIDTKGLARDAVHFIEVVTADRAGNSSTVRIPFRVGAGEGKPEPGPALGAGLLTGAYMFGDLVSLDAELLTAGSRARLDDLFPLAGLDGAYNARVADLPQEPVRLDFAGTPLPTVHLVGLRAERMNRVELADHGLRITAGRSALYGDAMTWVAAERSMPGSERLESGLLPVGDALVIGPVGLALRAPIELRWLSPDSNDERRALYVYNLRKDEWAFMPSTVDGDTVVTDIRGAGDFCGVRRRRSAGHRHAPSRGAHQLRDEQNLPGHCDTH